MKAAFKERFKQDIEVDGKLLEGIMDALDRVPRNPQFLALGHKIALELADAAERLFPGIKEIYRGFRHYLEQNPPA